MSVWGAKIHFYKHWKMFYKLCLYSGDPPVDGFRFFLFLIYSFPSSALQRSVLICVRSASWGCSVMDDCSPNWSINVTKSDLIKTWHQHHPLQLRGEGERKKTILILCWVTCFSTLYQQGRIGKKDRELIDSVISQSKEQNSLWKHIEDNEVSLVDKIIPRAQTVK